MCDVIIERVHVYYVELCVVTSLGRAEYKFVCIRKDKLLFSLSVSSLSFR